MIKRTTALALGLAGVVHGAFAGDYSLHQFQKTTLTRDFWAEGAYIGDFNHDGKNDVVYGPFWFAGPDFQKRFEYRPATATWKLKQADGTEKTMPGYEGSLGKNNAYSENFLTYTYDFNKDGWDDILIYGFPGKEVFWYENPKSSASESNAHWTKHQIFNVLDNESPAFLDVTGDGKPEIVCNSEGYLGYAQADWSAPQKAWTFHRISPKGDWQRYSHGVGIGDVNGDGRQDFLEKDGWWEQPASRDGDPVWKQHKVLFAPSAAQMFAYDVNGDGLNDVITCLDPHNYGLVWHEQYRENGQILFRKHVFMGKEPKDSKYGVVFTQPHALDLCDIDGDGLLDLVTGKRFWAHGPSGDSEPNAPAVLYWFQLKRGPNATAEFIPHRIDTDSGVGTQVYAADVNGDKLPDIIVGNKKGSFVFLHSVKKVDKAEWEQAQPKPLNP